MSHWWWKGDAPYGSKAFDEYFERNESSMPHVDYPFVELFWNTKLRVPFGDIPAGTMVSHLQVIDCEEPQIIIVVNNEPLRFKPLGSGVVRLATVAEQERTDAALDDFAGSE